jgi:hypothetical protein
MPLIKSRKTRNIERNNDVTVLVDTQNPMRGILRYGKAEIGYDDVHEEALTVVETSPAFIGMSKEKFQHVANAYVDAWKCVIVKIILKHITTFDYAKDETRDNFLKTYLQE